MLQNRLFVALASRSGFGASISDAIARSSIVFCNWVSADRIVVAASRLLGAAAACVILLSFAAEDCKSYWSGCTQAAIAICEQIFNLILALVIFLVTFLLKSVSKSSFCRFQVWSVDCEVSSAKCEVRRVQCEECSVKCVVWSVKTVKCEVWSGAWNVTCETRHQFRRVHARTGLAGARRMQVL